MKQEMPRKDQHLTLEMGFQKVQVQRTGARKEMGSQQQGLKQVGKLQTVTDWMLEVEHQKFRERMLVEHY